MTGKMPNPFEVPNEMRDLAAKSVEQAKRAFDSFIGAARKTSDTIAGATPQLPGQAREAGDAMIGMAEANVKAAFELAENLVRAKGLDEVMALQADYMRNQMSAMQAQMQDMGSMMQKAATPRKP
jgi:phasin